MNTCTHTTSTAPTRRAPLRRGFTLLELLTVVGIIVILVALVGGVGIAVIGKQKVTQTRNLLLSLDRALEEYITVVGAIPPYITTDYFKVPGESNDDSKAEFFRNYLNVQKNPVRPDAAVFLKQAMGVGDVQSIIAGLPPQFVVVTRGGKGNNLDFGDQDVTPSIIDTWANKNWPADADNNLWDITQQQVIYYVHPDNRLAQDLYGQCINRRPYFFSAGPDLKYGLKSEGPPGALQEEIQSYLDDNVYSYPVGVPNKDASFFSMYR